MEGGIKCPSSAVAGVHGHTLLFKTKSKVGPGQMDVLLYVLGASQKSQRDRTAQSKGTKQHLLAKEAEDDRSVSLTST